MTQLALLPTPPVPMPVRRLRGALVFGDEALARTYLARHGEYHRTARRVLVRVKPRLTAHGWVLCGWYSGVPWILYRDGKMRAWAARDVK